MDVVTWEQSSSFENAIVRLEAELERTARGVVYWQADEHAIFGSTALVMRGIIDRKPDDVDVFVSKRVWGSLLARPGWRVETPNAGDPPILCFPIHAYGEGSCDLHLFFDWSDPMVKIDVPVLLREAERVDFEGFRFRCASVPEVRRHKVAALSFGSEKVQKHRPDIEAIDKYLEEKRWAEAQAEARG